MRQGVPIQVRLVEHGLDRVQRLPTILEKDPDAARCVTNLRRQIDPVVLEKCHQCAAPAAGHRGRAESIFEDQVPADDPGKDLTQRGVAVGVGRAGDGDQRSEFRIA